MTNQPKTQHSKDREITVCVEERNLIIKTIYRWEYGDPIEADIDHILSGRNAVSLMVNVAESVRRIYGEDKDVSETMNKILALMSYVVAHVDLINLGERETKMC